MAKESEEWENEEPMHLRTKIALRVLLLMFKILGPYRFEHRFEKDIKGLEEDIRSIK